MAKQRAPSPPSANKENREQHQSRNQDILDMLDHSNPLYSKQNSKPQPHGSAAAHQPQFGKASPLGSKVDSSKYSNLFIKPKPGQHRPEHHRPSVPDVQSRHGPIAPRTNTGQAMPYSSSYYASAPLPTFASHPATTLPQPVGIQAIATRNFVDLTNSSSNLARPAGGDDSDCEFDPDAALRDTKFGEPHPFEYIDAETANKNIKALFEGAFDDDDEIIDKKARKLPRRPRKDKAAKDIGESLADKLGRLDVNPETCEESLPDEDRPDEQEVDDGTVDGLNVELLPHQIEGVGWMIEKEGGEKKKGIQPMGGILADDMGLGKTIQAMSLILSNPRPSNQELEAEKKEKKKRKPRVPLESSSATLVIAPLALIRQWESEIQSKSGDLSVLVHHGASRTKSAKKLESYDVVVTTYQIIASEHAVSLDTRPTGCFGVYWYRIILDEAHTIKNRSAKMTKACYDLDATYRWCLTGTPMQNNPDELQSLIHFLQIKPYSDLQVWKSQIGNPLKTSRGGVAMRRLQYFLKAFMKRRTKDVLKRDGALGKADGGSSSTGFRIVGRDVQTLEVQFMPHERQFYDRLEARAGDNLKEMMSGERKDYIGALVLLLRMRQACNHPHLIMAKMDKDQDALDTGPTDLSARQGSKHSTVHDLADVADLLGGMSIENKKCDVCKSALTRAQIASNQLRCLDCDADLQRGLDADPHRPTKHKKHRKNTAPSAERQRLRAARQRRVVVSDDEDQAKWIASTSQRGTVLQDDLNTDDEDDEGGGQWLGQDDSQTGSEDDDDEHDAAHSSQGANATSDEQAQLSSTCISTKIQHLLEILDKETLEHKVIVFSQFTTMLDIMEPFLKKANHQYSRYDGSMRNDLREASLNMLRNHQQTRVLLCSLKCGSLGLNLTAASRVVLMEPFWNPFVEEQAIDRVHRLNQTRDVVVYRLTVADTIEARILELQEYKRKMAKTALEGGKSMGKLSMQDILNLFRFDLDHRHRDDHEQAVDKAEAVRLMPGRVHAVQQGSDR